MLVDKINIWISGSTGFVGTNLIENIKNNDLGNFNSIKRDKLNKIDELTELFNSNHDSVIIHLAGKAHDLLTVSKPDDYYNVNTELTKNIFKAFINSKAKTFIFLSTVKASADTVDGMLTEDNHNSPKTHYGKSKKLAEDFIVNNINILEKKIYILRPCMIHGPGNKGNLNLLYKFVRMGIPWPLGAFENKRSFCSINNLCFIIQELIKNDHIHSGVYNVADDESLSTNDIIRLIGITQNKKIHIWNIPKPIVNGLTKLGDLIKLPFNTERLHKLTETYVVCNSKIKQAINKSLPVTSREGLTNTFNSFNSNA